MEEKMKKLFEEIYEYFEKDKILIKKVELFSKNKSKFEGWFNGELLYFFRYKCEDIEIKSCGDSIENKRKPDLILAMDGEEIILELKSFFISVSKSSMKLERYFHIKNSADPNKNIGVPNDFRSLVSYRGRNDFIKPEDNEYLMIFAHSKDNIDEWDKKVKELEEKQDKIKHLVSKVITSGFLISLWTNKERGAGSGG